MASFLNSGSHDPTRCKTGILSTDYCGRPLGLVMTEGSRLFVADAWRGLLEVDVSIQPTEAELLGKLPSENVKVLSNSSTDGERILFADGLEIDKKGVNLYLTSLSQRSRIDVFAFCCFEDPPSGRLYRHNLRFVGFRDENSPRCDDTCICPVRESQKCF
eukprot:GHVS01104884.1.p1 GENE.GHVS01104884.1~~GHVS01104884.1.p1  ORF type:complete len:160 (+),score=7.13 GHVS01104884.1:806-1285(+)